MPRSYLYKETKGSRPDLAPKNPTQKGRKSTESSGRKPGMEIDITEEMLTKIQNWSEIRMPYEQMAILLEMNPNTFRKYATISSDIKRAIDKGRALGYSKLIGSTYDRAMKTSDKLAEIYIKEFHGIGKEDRVNNEFENMSDEEIDRKLKELMNGETDAGTENRDDQAAIGEEETISGD